MLHAVIFDFDGIIVDTEPVHYRAYQEIFVPLGIGFSWEEYVSRYFGFDDREIFRRVFSASKQGLDNVDLEQLMSQKATAFRHIAGSGLKPYPGVAELIRALSGNLPLALCSGAVRSDISPILERFDLSIAFDAIVTADDVAVSKPDAESYRLALSKLSSAYPDRDILPGSCLAIEDTPAGIASAKAAEMQVLAVTNSYPAERLSDAGFIVDSLECVAVEVLKNTIPL